MCPRLGFGVTWTRPLLGGPAAHGQWLGRTQGPARPLPIPRTPQLCRGAHLPEVLQVELILDIPGRLRAHCPAACQEVQVVNPALQVLGGRPGVPFWARQEDNQKKKNKTKQGQVRFRVLLRFCVGFPQQRSKMVRDHLSTEDRPRGPCRMSPPSLQRPPLPTPPLLFFFQPPSLETHPTPKD